MIENYRSDLIWRVIAAIGTCARVWRAPASPVAGSKTAIGRCRVSLEAAPRLRSFRCASRRACFRSMTGRKRPEGATPSGLGRNDRSWGVASGRSFMANTVAENQTTRASTRALYSTLTSGNNAHPIHAAFRPGKPRIAESVASVGVGESNAAGTLCQVACFPLIGLASRYRSPSHLIACPLATL